MQNIQNTKKEEVDVQKVYGEQCTLTKEEFIKKYKVNTDGLSKNQAQNKLNKYGLNEIRQAKPKKWYNYFFESLFSPFNSILLRYCCYSYLY